MIVFSTCQILIRAIQSPVAQSHKQCPVSPTWQRLLILALNQRLSWYLAYTPLTLVVWSESC